MSQSQRKPSAILVPLDGSELAERALPSAELLARGTASRLLLVRIVPETRWTTAGSGYLLTPHIYDEIMATEEQGARAYLERVAASSRTSGLTAETLVRRGNPPAVLAELATSDRLGFVVLATHGRSGVERFALGSVADRIVHTARMPVLLIRPFGDERHLTRLERALVPLDGSSTAERALAVAEQLAGGVLHHVLLTWVVDPEHESGETADARRYLDETRDRLTEAFTRRDCTLDTVVLYGRPAEQILERSKEQDIVIMGTHGRGGISRWALGSVADRVLHQIRLPLLLVRKPDGSEDVRAQDYGTRAYISSGHV